MSTRDLTSLTIESVPVDLVRPLRHRVLRPMQDFSWTFYPEDQQPQAFHLAAILDREVVGVISSYQEACPLDGYLNPASHWRFRGMAVHADLQGRGIGRLLVGRSLEEYRLRGAGLVWCNARVTAFGFYGSLGFRCEGPQFMIEPVGAHSVMLREV